MFSLLKDLNWFEVQMYFSLKVKSIRILGDIGRNSKFQAPNSKQIPKSKITKKLKLTFMTSSWTFG